MGLFSSILNLTVVVAAGWFTIYYLIPKIEAGTLNIPGLPSTDEKLAIEGSDEEPGMVAGEIADAVTGDESGTTDAAPDPKEKATKCKKGKKCKEPYDPLKGMAGKGESKKKKSKESAKAEYRIMEYLTGDYGYGYGIY